MFFNVCIFQGRQVHAGPTGLQGTVYHALSGLILASSAFVFKGLLI